MTAQHACRQGARCQRLLFLALGRRGAIPRLALQLARAGAERADLEQTFVIARSSDLLEDFSFLAHRLLSIDTLEARAPSATLRNYFSAERQVLQHVARDRPDAVINLCPHLWTPLLMSRIRKQRVPFVTVMHDAIGHPGDPGALLAPWFRAEARAADAVVTLSRSVADALRRDYAIPGARILPLFLPDLNYGARPLAPKTIGAGPFRLLLFGRLLKYKGLDLVLDALENLTNSGVRVRLTVAGAGKLGGRSRARLATLRAEIINRWIAEAEVRPLLDRHDSLVASHVECSQSGVVATAFGSGLPVIAVPVGGLVEQVVDGKTGVLATAPTAKALATAVRRLATGAGLYEAISANLHATAADRSTRRFLDALLCQKPWARSSFWRAAA